LLVAKGLRLESEKWDSITLPDFFAARFGKYANAIRVIASLIIVFFFTFYLAAQFNGAGKVLNVTFNIPNFWGIVIGTIVIIFYTMMGGFFAVAWTDFIQGIIMIGTLVVLPVVGLIELHSNGQGLLSVLEAQGPFFADVFGGAQGWAAFAIIISGLSWGFGYLGQPHLLIRFMAIKNPSGIKKSRIIAFLWAIPAFSGAMIIGLIGLAMYGQGYFADIEHIMPVLATRLLPAWLAGIFISGAIAAMMSTADSQLLVITSSVIEDFYHKTLGKDLSDKVLLNLSRLITVAVGLLGFFIAITSEKLIFSLVSYAWAGLGASFGPSLLLILKWKHISPKAVIASMLTGTITTIVWSEISFLDDAISVRFSAFALSFAMAVIVSLLDKQKRQS